MAHVSFPKSPDSWGTGACHRNHCNISLETKIMQGGLFSSKISYNHCIKIFTWGGGPTGSFKICLVAMEKSVQLWTLQGQRS